MAGKKMHDKNTKQKYNYREERLYLKVHWERLALPSVRLRYLLKVLGPLTLLRLNLARALYGWQTGILTMQRNGLGV